MELYIVRHGETYSNTGLVKGEDTVLTDTGLEQADYLGKSLSDVHFDKIYSSHMSRAVQTAAAVIKYQSEKQPIRVVPEFCERGVSDDFTADTQFHKTVYDNIIYEETSIKKKYGGDIERVQEALNRYVFLPAYSEASLETKKGNDIIKSNPEKILIAAHGGINAVMLSCLVGFRFDINMNIVQQNTCVNRFELFLHNGIPRIKFISYNDISHLPQNLRTEHP